MFVKSNLSSMTSQRHLNKSVLKEAKSAQKLGSGLRINQAGDDAAGLAIATRMEASLKGTSKAIQSNIQSISMMQPAEGALNEQNALLQRMRELTVQSLNNTYQDADRQSLQEEVKQLTSQFDDVAEVSFNNQKIFDKDVVLYSDDELGGVGQLSKFFESKNANRVARQSIHHSQTGVNQEDLEAGDIVITNQEGEIFSIRATHDVDDQLSTTNKSSSAIAKAKVINEFTDESGLEAIVNETRFTGNNPVQAVQLDTDSYLRINGAIISGFEVQENDGNGALVDAINAAHEDTGVTAHLNAESKLVLVAQDGRNIEVEAVGDANRVGFGVSTVATGSLTMRCTKACQWSYSDSFVDAKIGYFFNNLIQLNPGTASSAHSVGPGWQFISQNAGAGFVAPEWQGHEDSNIVLSGKYNGDIPQAVGNRFHIEVDTGNGGVYLAALSAEDANGESIANYSFGTIPFDASGSGTYIFASTDTVLPPPPAVGGIQVSANLGSGNIFIFQFKGANLVDSIDTDGDGVDAFQFTAPVGDLAPLDFVIGLGYDETVDSLDISSVARAKQALFTIDLALEEISAARSEYGALINYYESAVRSLESEQVNLSAAQSRIQDTDFAQQTAQLAQAQINKQAGVSVLAQANTIPSLVLELLG